MGESDKKDFDGSNSAQVRLRPTIYIVIDRGIDIHISLRDKAGPHIP